MWFATYDNQAESSIAKPNIAQCRQMCHTRTVTITYYSRLNMLKHSIIHSTIQTKIKQKTNTELLLSCSIV